MKILPANHDFLTKPERSKLMGRIRSRGTQLEVSFKEAMQSARIPFRYQPKLVGKPDFMIKPSIVVFCDSAFWHGRNWRELKPRLKSQYWIEHIGKTRVRDRRTNAKLRAAGYTVLRFWDDDITKKPENCVARVQREIARLQ